MVDSFSELNESISQLGRMLKQEENVDNAINVIRKELYSYLSLIINQLKENTESNNKMFSLFIEKMEKVSIDQSAKMEKLLNDSLNMSKRFDSKINSTTMNNNKALNDIVGEVKKVANRDVKISSDLFVPMIERLDGLILLQEKQLEMQEQTSQALEGLYFYTGQKKVNRAGKPEMLSHKMRTKSIVVIAESTNIGTIYVGGRGVGADTAGAKLRPGESIPMDVDLEKREIWIDGTHSGDGVTFISMAYKSRIQEGGSR